MALNCRVPQKRVGNANEYLSLLGFHGHAQKTLAKICISRNAQFQFLVTPIEVNQNPKPLPSKISAKPFPVTLKWTTHSVWIQTSIYSHSFISLFSLFINILPLIYNPGVPKANQALGFTVLPVKRHVMVSPGQRLTICEEKGSKTN